MKTVGCNCDLGVDCIVGLLLGLFAVDFGMGIGYMEWLRCICLVSREVLVCYIDGKEIHFQATLFVFHIVSTILWLERRRLSIQLQ